MTKGKASEGFRRPAARSQRPLRGWLRGGRRRSWWARLRRRANRRWATIRQATITEAITPYVERIASLRQGAADPQRDAYTVALGQLHALGLIDETTWREALDRPRTTTGGQ